MFGILVFLFLLGFIPLTISLTYLLLGIVNVLIGAKEKNNLKIRSVAKTIFYSFIAFIATLLIWAWIANSIDDDFFGFF